ncbi:MAG: MBL fold metallo-hydrolase [Candidatus Marinimicrobia bacterium]|nr:MBL fold metallo-hydrolase [Candidatus Neomarinimicrobiota bacterium]
MCLPLRFKLGTVNCYLLKVNSGYILIDTGGTNNRSALEEKLRNAGCIPGNLKLIILTHGDFDHIGNASYLRQKYKAELAMHQDDFGMIEHGDMFWNRKKPNIFIKILAGLLFKLKKADRAKPDLTIHEGFDLSGYGLSLAVVHVPGHSMGSIGILASGGEFFCGDLFENTKQPTLNTIMDDIETAYLSVERLRKINISTIYPGHGEPFTMDQLNLEK